MKQREYKVLEPSGKTTKHVLDKKATLEQLQAWVGGYIQMVQILPKQWIVVNEEGGINGMERNPNMTYQGQSLFGNIVLLPRGCRG